MIDIPLITQRYMFWIILAGEALQSLDSKCGKAANCKRMKQSGNIIQRETTLSPEDPFENIKAILIQKLISSAIQLNSAALAYNSVLLTDVTIYVADIVEHFSHFAFLFRYGY